MRQRLRGRGGFSLVEVLVAMILMFVVLGGIYTVWFGLQRTYSFTEDDMKAQAEARAAMGEMVQTIRTGQFPANISNASVRLVIPYADAETLVLWMDVAHDETVGLQLVRFRLDPSNHTLVRETNPSKTADPAHYDDMTFSHAASTRLVSNFVINDKTATPPTPLFSYGSAGGAALGSPVLDPTDIGIITIDLRLDVNTQKHPVFHELRSVVQPRNLRQY